MEQASEIRITCAGNTTVSLDELKDFQGNLKELSEDNYAKLRNSMIEFGFSFPIFYWQDEAGTKWIIDAHQRIRTLSHMQKEGVVIPPLPADPIFATDRTEAKKKLLLLNSRYGEMTQEGFDEFTADINIEEISDLLELPEVMVEGQEESQAIEDEAPAVSGEPAKSELGKVYQLGRHRLICGDATKIEDVEKLMNGQKADMVFTDPPYGMNLDTDYAKRPLTEAAARKHPGQNSYDSVIGDDKPYDPSHLFEMFGYCREMFLWGGDYYAHRLPEDGSWIVWDKKKGIEDVQYTNSEFELCWSKQRHQRQIVRVTWFGLIGTESQDVTNRIHPTQKPIQLCSWFIEKYSKPDHAIVDLFGGSGSTLIACEQTNRTCYMSEIDNRYTDVIIKRWMKFTGKRAYEIKEENGKQSYIPVVFADESFMESKTLQEDSEVLSGKYLNTAQKNAGQSEQL